MIGLGVGIDYALFIVTRHLEQRRDGMDTRESIARASAISGGAVVFAGCTVMVALVSLAVVQIPLVTTLGYTAALVVAIAVLAAITLLPAVLAIVGDRIDKLRIPLPHGKADGRSHGWTRWSEFVAGHPWPSALVAIVVLAALALPALNLYLGQQDNGALPQSTDARRAFDGLSTGFGPGTNGPLLISVDLSKQPAKADQANLDKLSKQEDKKDKRPSRRPARRRRSPGSWRRKASRPPRRRPRPRRSSSRSSTSRSTRSSSSRSRSASSSRSRPPTRACRTSRRTSPRRRASRRSPSRS